MQKLKNYVAPFVDLVKIESLDVLTISYEYQVGEPDPFNPGHNPWQS
ncbi:MAG: hypothetical protein IJX98_02070 [Clostridia bacterium]|nr:hypothetical protein [Clostridia bacterium]